MPGMSDAAIARSSARTRALTCGSITLSNSTDRAVSPTATKRGLMRVLPDNDISRMHSNESDVITSTRRDSRAGFRRTSHSVRHCTNSRAAQSRSRSMYDGDLHCRGRKHHCGNGAADDFRRTAGSRADVLGFLDLPADAGRYRSMAVSPTCMGGRRSSWRDPRSSLSALRYAALPRISQA
jgi:hypothetical protein